MAEASGPGVPAQIEVELWTRSGADPNNRTRRVEAKCIWAGVMPAVPRVGDLVEEIPGSSTVEVRRIAWCRTDTHEWRVQVELDSIDADGELPTWPLPRRR